MRTVIVIAIGLVLAALFLRLMSASHRTLAASLFTLMWFAVSGWNLRTGLAHGYSLSEELPIHLALFGVPVLFAWGLWWFRHG
ncbi:hypothetical protein [Luteibacter yeojuensis]